MEALFQSLFALHKGSLTRPSRQKLCFSDLFVKYVMFVKSHSAIPCTFSRQVKNERTTYFSIYVYEQLIKYFFTEAGIQLSGYELVLNMGRQIHINTDGNNFHPTFTINSSN